MFTPFAAEERLLAFLATSLFISCCLSLSGQAPSSYVRELSQNHFNVPVNSLHILSGSDGSVSACATYIDLLDESVGTRFSLTSISPDGQAAGMHLVSSPDSLQWWSAEYGRDGDAHLAVLSVLPSSINPTSQDRLFLVQPGSGGHWCKVLNDGSYVQKAAFLDGGRIVTTHWAETPRRTGLACFDRQTGAQHWGYYYLPDTVGVAPPVSGYFGVGFFARLGMVATPGGDILVAGLRSLTLACMLAVGPDGQPRQGVRFGAADGRRIHIQSLGVDASGAIYAAGRLYDPLSPFTSYFSKLFIAKFSPDMGLVWAKEMVADMFYNRWFDFSVSPNGEVVFVCATHGELPVVAGKLSPQGELLWKRGYEFYDPAITIGADGSVYFMTNRKYNSNGTSEAATVIAKADFNGDIAECPQFDACLSFVDIEMTVGPEAWTVLPAPDLADCGVLVEPASFSTTPHCGTPPAPTPDFLLPDTLCARAILSPTGLNNRLAHHAEWRITGPGLDTLLADTTFRLRFALPGEYVVEQEIWLLGCAYLHARTLTVLPDDLAPPLGADRTLCQAPPYALLPQSSRPLRSFLWGDSSTAPSLPVAASGAYTLSASDGYCAVRDTVALTFVQDLLTLGPPLALPPDTVPCRANLPYLLLPQSPYVDSFRLDGSAPAASFALDVPGTYLVTAEVFGCTFSQPFVLTASECRASVYLPNAFSPNDDGINDRYAAQGLDFEALRLEVYDRWGGLLHVGGAAAPYWDGRVEGQLAPPGEYVVLLRYRNVRTGEEEWVTGGFVLMR